MNTISITTAQNIDLEYDLASLGERILGRIIDGLILAAYVIVLLALIGFGNFDNFITNNVSLDIIFILPIVFYDLLSESLLNGQSIGKKVMTMKVISLNGDQPRFSQYLIRWLFRIVDFTISSSLVALIMVAANQRKQRLGDLVAGTTLIKTKPRTNLQQTLYVPTANTEYKVIYPEVVNLTDQDMQLIKEILIAVNKSGNTMLAYEAMIKIQSVLNIKSQSEPLNFLYTVLADYNHLASKL